MDGDSHRMLMDDDEPVDGGKDKKQMDKRNWPDAD